MARDAVAYALFEDPENVDLSSAGLFERVLNWAVYTFQPYPIMSHVEFAIVILDESESMEVSHYATYNEVGGVSAWRSSKDPYYAKATWHAIPVAAGVDSVRKLVEACKETERSPYSMLRYLVSTRMFGVFAGLLADKDTSEAHCGGLSARVLHKSGTHAILEPAPRYGPSYLYNHLLDDHRYALVSQEMSRDASILLHESDAKLRELGYARCVDELRRHSHVHTFEDTKSLGRMVQRLILLSVSSEHPLEVV